MIPKLFGALLVAASIALGAQAAEARRIALVIGISRYTSLKPLANPVNDATTIAGLLRANGFVVFAYSDLSRAQLLDALDAFKNEADNTDVALIYYAGHGLEIGGRNIVAPADMEFSCEQAQPRRAVELDKLFEAIQNAPQQVVLLDACRNDPLPQCARATSSGGGFRGIEIVAHGHTRVLVANSTLSGRLADDGPRGGHSPFATTLLAHLQGEPRTPLRNLLDEVARDVALGSNGAQTPEVTTQGGAPEVCLASESCGGTSAAAPTSVPPAARASLVCNADLDYQDALRKNTVEAYRDFLSRCPNDKRKETVLGLYARLADEEMWQNVSKANTLSGYVQYQVAFPSGIYLEQARQKQIELERLAKPAIPMPPGIPSPIPSTPPSPSGIGGPFVPVSLWKHNGSIVFLEAEGTQRRFKYYQPIQGMQRAGALPGSLLFQGNRVGNSYTGTAYIFSANCGRFPYPVNGTVAADDRSVVMYGDKPRIDRQRCVVVGHDPDTLVFEFQGE